MNEPKNGVDILAEVSGNIDVIQVRRPRMSPGWCINQRDFATWDDVKKHLQGVIIHETTEV